MRSFLAALLFAAILPGAEVPRQSPEYAIALADGRQQLLTSYKGKVVVLEFMFTTCPHCQNTSRILTKLQSELGPKGFQAVGVAINPDPDVPNFIRRFNVNFPVGTGSRDSAYAYLEKSVMAPFSVPQIVIIDRKGVIRGQYTGTDTFIASDEEANLRTTIQKLLAESGTPPSPAKVRRKAS
jgi:cytochrome oxidase Cu insertion factor (SCO1/SenC/PrrC family)